MLYCSTMSGGNFFDFRDKLSAKAPPAAAQDALTVTQLTARIERALKTLPPVFLVRGEVSNFKPHAASGHLYFTLKDAGAAINCVMWKSDAVKLKFKCADGMELLATGRVAVYPQQGKYQLYVTSLGPLGQGALELAFQQLRGEAGSRGAFSAAAEKNSAGLSDAIGLGDQFTDSGITGHAQGAAALPLAGTDGLSRAGARRRSPGKKSRRRWTTSAPKRRGRGNRPDSSIAWRWIAGGFVGIQPGGCCPGDCGLFDSGNNRYRA